MIKENTFPIARVSKHHRTEAQNLLNQHFPSAKLREHPDPFFLSVSLPNKEADLTQPVRTLLRHNGLLDR